MKIIKNYGSLIAFLLGVGALVSLYFGPAAMYNGKPVEAIVSLTRTEPVNGYGLIFGTEIGAFSVTSFNILGFIGFLLLIVGTLLPLSPKGGASKHLIALMALVPAAVLLFVFLQTIEVITAETVVSNPKYDAGTPLILSAALSLLSGILNGVIVGVKSR